MLGCGDVGSAVALVLHRAGLDVVIVDEADPPWHRRGMAFTDAWYVGNAALEREGACFCGSLKSIPSVLANGLIVATTWSWPGVAAELGPTVLVDARRRERRGTHALRGRVPLTIGVGVAPHAAGDVDVGIEIPMSAAYGPWRGGNAGAGVVDDAGCVDPFRRCPTVDAWRPGRFVTQRQIGELVHSGEIVGGLGNEVVRAPGSGILIGLAARGARIEPGDTLVEVDPEGDALACFGMKSGPRLAAATVLSALREPAAPRCAANGLSSSCHMPPG